MGDAVSSSLNEKQFKVKKNKMRIRESAWLMLALVSSGKAETTRFTLGESIPWLIDVLGFSFLDLESAIFDYIFLFLVVVCCLFVWRILRWKKVL